MLPMSTCAKRDKYATFLLVKTNFDDDWGSFDTEPNSRNCHILSYQRIQTLLFEERETNAIMDGGGGGVLFMNY